MGKGCGFEYEGRKCKLDGDGSIARCVDLCKVHYNTVTKDNVRRFNKGQEIPKAMIFTRKLLNSETWSKVDFILKKKKGVK